MSRGQATSANKKEALKKYLPDFLASFAGLLTENNGQIHMEVDEGQKAFLKTLHLTEIDSIDLVSV